MPYPKKINITLLFLFCLLSSSKIGLAQCNDFVKISTGLWHTLGIKKDGSLWAWGLNDYGQLGDSAIGLQSNIPIKINSDTDWVDVAVGRFSSFALKKDGTRWYWGANEWYLFGDTTFTYTKAYTPKKCEADSNWIAISIYSSHLLAIKKNHTLWAWGKNNYGQLGINSTKDSSRIPVQIGTDSNWAKISAGGTHSLGLKMDGTLYAWGANYQGQLGDYTNILKIAPTPIDTAYKWKEITCGLYHSLGIRQDGSLWAWGYAYFGQLGIGSLYAPIYKNSPQNLSMGVGWAKIGAGDLFSVGLKNDGTLWLWGGNGNGELGDGTYTPRASPYNIDYDTTWDDISLGHNQIFAFKKNNTLWGWGLNSEGQLGIKSFTLTFTSPQKVDGVPQIVGKMSACLNTERILSTPDSLHTIHPWQSSDTMVATITSAGIVTAKSVGTTFITLTNEKDCAVSEVFTVKPLPKISGYFNACFGDTVLLAGTDTSRLFGPWHSTNSAVGRIFPDGKVVALAAGSTIITFIDRNECFDTATFLVKKITPKPIVVSPLFYCQFAMDSALVAKGTNIKWYNSPSSSVFSTSTPTIATSVAGKKYFYVSQTDSVTKCESLRDSIVLTIRPQPTPPIVISPINYCQDALTTSLSAIGSRLQWYDTAIGGVGSFASPTPISISVGSSVFYTSQTDSFGCESKRDSIIVQIKPTPNAPKVVSPLLLCHYSVADSLSADGENLKWYTAASDTTGSIFVPKPSTDIIDSFSFFVSQTNDSGCESNSAKIFVEIKPLPVVKISSLASSGFLFCRKNSIVLKANTNSICSFQWFFENTIINAAKDDSVFANKTGTYQIEATNQYFCKGKDFVFVQQDTSAIPKLSPASVKICEGDSQLLVVNPESETWVYNWYNLEGQIDSIKNKTSNYFKKSNAYWLVTTNDLGCKDTTNIADLSVPPKVKPIITYDNLVLKTQSVYISYQWYKNGETLTGQTKNTLTIANTGKYVVETIDINGCILSSDTADIFIKPTYINNIKVYPNPTNSIIKIEAPVVVNLKLFDIAGKMIYDKASTKELNLESLAEGVYVLYISGENNELLKIEKIVRLN